MTELR